MKALFKIYLLLVLGLLISNCEKDEPEPSPVFIEDPDPEITVEEAYPGMQGEIMDVIVGDDAITVEIINGGYVFQGDIMMTEVQ